MVFITVENTTSGKLERHELDMLVLSVGVVPPKDLAKISGMLTLSKTSDLPETFGGYHFLILDSDEINAFAAPGGFIFVTRGLLRCCKHEDAAAAVLAHEIGHVELRHGLQAIKKSRITTALTTLGIAGVKTFGGDGKC